MTGVIYTDQALEKTIFKGYVLVNPITLPIRLCIGLFVPALVLALWGIVSLIMCKLTEPGYDIGDSLGCISLIFPLLVVWHLIELIRGIFDRNQLYETLLGILPIENISKKKKQEDL